MFSRHICTQHTLMRAVVYVQRCLRTMLSGTNHAGCVSIPANSKELVPENPGKLVLHQVTLLTSVLLAVLSSVALSQVNVVMCIAVFFCDEPETSGEKLRDVMTLELDRKVKQCANKLQDNKLLVKLSNASDMVALEAKYHLKCLASLYNRVRSIERKQSFEPNKPEHTKSLVFAQLVSYIDECRLDDSAIPVFRLGDLVKLYNERFTQLGGLGGAHSTRLKEQLLAQFPDMHAYDEGRDVLLMFDYDVGPTVAMACQIDWQRDALCLSRIAQIVRQDIFQFRPAFDGFFQANCQEQSVPSSLLALVSMILEGPSISNQTCKQQIPAALELAQLIVYNSVNHARPHSEQQHATK